MFPSIHIVSKYNQSETKQAPPPMEPTGENGQKNGLILFETNWRSFFLRILSLDDRSEHPLLLSYTVTTP